MHNNRNNTFLLALKMLNHEDIDREDIDTSYKEILEMHLSALIEDIKNIESIIEASYIRNDQEIVITIKSHLNKIELKNSMKIYLVREFDYFRYISLEIENT